MIRILFAGTPEIAVPTLKALITTGKVVAVLTNPDKPGPRGKTPVPSPVKSCALEAGLPVIQPERLLADARTLVEEYKPNLLISFAYGRLFGPKFLSLFSLGGINIHPSLLPKYRGSTPIQSAILAGDSETGISVQYIAERMDEGDLLAVERFTLSGTENTETLSHLVAQRAASVILQVVTKLEQGTLVAIPQQGAATYTKHVEKNDALIDWNQSAKTLHAKIRGYYPWPKAETTYRGERLYVTSVSQALSEVQELTTPQAPGTVVGSDKQLGIGIATGKGTLWVDRLQLATRKELDWRSFLNGNPDMIGTMLGG